MIAWLLLQMVVQTCLSLIGRFFLSLWGGVNPCEKN